jgi:hypothetical protein
MTLKDSFLGMHPPRKASASKITSQSFKQHNSFDKSAPSVKQYAVILDHERTIERSQGASPGLHSTLEVPQQMEASNQVSERVEMLQ